MAIEDYKQFVFAFLAAVSFGLISIIFVLTWVLHYREGLAWDGGAAEFNWHPVLIVVGFVFLQGIGTRDSRRLKFTNEQCERFFLVLACVC